MSTPAPPPPEAVRLDVEVTMPDVEAFNLLVAFSPRLRARWRRQFLLIYGLAAVVLPGWNLYSLGLAGFDPLAHGIVPLLILGVLAAIVTPLSYAAHRWNVRRVVRAMVGRSPREDYLGPKRIEASPEGISVSGANSLNRYGWDAVIGLRETEGLLLVMLGETLAILVPKRGQDPARLEALRAMVRARAAPPETKP
ncbi:YcxB family protein [Roseomonas alkaliterrae]|uniref:YcxB-like C-terminal domain-containing protein n=1 Tax=Neoroseomonas alkaliterrae TaxID=1452450 RepID=A0A840Y456_9PROT|nr:YcxB family protein [Neoroseomonas alkaliterrae]MBB5690771.1 hypothetical protein [Neoroseomonas alkaliterrae]MBR0677763.1 YcxB family protein [Neoroseomonas alkaliterrae]